MNKRWKEAQDYEIRHRARNKMSEEAFRKSLELPNFDWNFFWKQLI